MHETKEYSRDTMTASLPTTTLIICSRNRPQMLWETIQSILAGREVPTEILILDQSDKLDPVLSDFQPEKDCKIRYLWSHEQGVSLGRNMAIAAASYPILVITDDDMFVAPDWFGLLIRTLVAAGTTTVITGRVLASEDRSDGFAPSIADDEHLRVHTGRAKHDVLSTGNMALYRSAFELVGTFDERLGPGTSYPASEDNDLGFRLLEAGYTIIYEPNAVVYHRTWRSKKEFLLLHWGYGLGQGAFFAKYFSIKDSHMIRRMVRVVSNHLIRLPYRLLFDCAQAYRDVYFITGLLTGAIRWTIKERHNQA